MRYSSVVYYRYWYCITYYVAFRIMNLPSVMVTGTTKDIITTQLSTPFRLSTILGFCDNSGKPTVSPAKIPIVRSSVTILNSEDQYLKLAFSSS